MDEQDILNENQIVENAKTSEQAFGLLYNRYFEQIFGFVFRRTDDETLASDLTSQTFLKALGNIKKYEFRGLPFSAWLFRIASNEVNRHFRKKNKQKLFSLEEVKIKDFIDLDDCDDKERLIQLLLECLKSMPTQVIEVLELRFFEGLDFKEISYVLEISESGAKMRTYRALEKLKAVFNQKVHSNGKA